MNDYRTNRIGVGLDLLGEMTEEHDEILYWMRMLKVTIDNLQEPETEFALELLEVFLGDNLLKHFDMEDTKLFPSLAASTGSPELVEFAQDMAEEHRELRREIRYWLDLVHAYLAAPSDRTGAPVVTAGHRLRHALLGHSARENVAVLPVLRQHRRAFTYRSGGEPLPL